MSMTNDLLDAAKKNKGFKSDYALAKAVGLGTGRISQYRSGRFRVGEELAVELAELAGLDPLGVLADLQAENAKSEEVRKIWKRAGELARQVSTAACVILAIAIAGAMPGNADAATVSASAPKQTISPSIYYAQLFMDPLTWCPLKYLSSNQSVSLRANFTPASRIRRIAVASEPSRSMARHASSIRVTS
jgi:transcriptional regulator with XRE-family HTH domain